MHPPIENGCIKLSIDVQVVPQLVTKLLLQILVREPMFKTNLLNLFFDINRNKILNIVLCFEL